jgi:hypothetical protein
MSELDITPPAPGALSPEDVAAILADLKTFGIADNEEIITLTVKGKKVNIRVANVSNDDEIFSQIRTEGLKGFAWVQRMRCEILARAVTWLNGVNLAEVEYALDPYSKEERPIRLILADMFMKWGQEAILVLWKIYMVHCQRIEDSLTEQLPDSLVMTEVERRFMDRIGEELAQVGALAITETAELAATPLTPEGTTKE